VLAATMILSLRIPPSGKGGGAYPFGSKKPRPQGAESH
jgi:hypothetical protein